MRNLCRNAALLAAVSGFDSGFFSIISAAHLGCPQVDTPGWQAMWAPAGTPRERIVRLNTEIVRILKTPDMRGRIEESGLRPIGGTPEASASFIESDFAFFEKAIRAAKLEPR